MFGTTATARSVFTLVILLFTAACYEHTYTMGAGAPHAPVVYERWHNHWLGGLISPDQEIELGDGE